MVFEIIAYFLSAIAMMLIFFIPGFLSSLFFRRLDSVEKITVSFFFSVSWIIIIFIAYHYAGFEASPAVLIPLSVLSLILFVFVRKQVFGFRMSKEVKLLLLLFFIIFMAKITAQIFIKYYPAGSDYVGHYKTALYFLGNEWKLPDSYINPDNPEVYIPYRTPGFYMPISFFMSIFGSSFWVCQIAATLLNTVFIFPTYCIAKKFFSKKIALLTIVFLTIIPFVETSLYIHAKMLVAYFAFLMFYLFTARKLSPFIIGSVAGLGLMIHQSFFIFVLAMATPYLFDLVKKRSKSELIFALKIAFAFSLVILPWFAINYLKYGTPLSSDYAYFPLYTTNYGAGNYSPLELWDNFKKTSPLYIVGARVINTVTFATPAILVSKIAALFFPFTLDTGKTNPPVPVNFASGRDLPWAYHYYHSLPGILTMLMYVFAVIGFIKLWGYNKKLFYFVLIPIIFTIIWYGWVVLVIIRSGVPEVIPIFVIIGFWEISKRKDREKMVKLVFLLAIIELVIFSIFFSWHIGIAEQIAIERKGDPKYLVDIDQLEKLFSAYKLFKVQEMGKWL